MQRVLFWSRQTDFVSWACLKMLRVYCQPKDILIKLYGRFNQPPQPSVQVQSPDRACLVDFLLPLHYPWRHRAS